MSPELMALTTLVALQILFGISTSLIVGSRAGIGYLFSSREDEGVDLTSGFVGRMHRARTNNFEAMAYFTPTVAVVELAGTNSETTAAAAWVFVTARIGFILCYAFDLTPWRTLVWYVGTIAVATMLIASVS